MEERKFTWFPKLTHVILSVPDTCDRGTLITAIAEYGTFGTEPNLEYPLSAIFEAVREDIDNSANARGNNKGGRPRKETQVSEVENGGLEVSETCETGVSQTENGGFDYSENQETPLINTKPNHTKDMPSQNKGEPPYPLACLAALNEELGTAYGSLPPKAAQHLQSMEGRYPVEEVRAMVAYKRDEWRGTRFARNLTPNTLFGAEHFEQYMHQAKAGREESDEFAEYD